MKPAAQSFQPGERVIFRSRWTGMKSKATVLKPDASAPDRLWVKIECNGKRMLAHPGEVLKMEKGVT